MDQEPKQVNQRASQGGKRLRRTPGMGWRRPLLLVCALSLVAGLFALTMHRQRRSYEDAVEELEQGNYAEAHEQLEGLGDFRNSDALAEEARQELAYEEAGRLMESEAYREAGAAYEALGDFRDAQELAGRCEHLAEVADSYSVGVAWYDSGELKSAYEAFESIVDENFKDTPVRLESVTGAIRSAVLSEAAAGRLRVAVSYLNFLEEIGDAQAETLREQLTAQEHMDPDYSFYESMGRELPTSFSSDTSEEDFAAVFQSMYLTGTMQVYITADGIANDEEDTVQALLSRALLGNDIADERLPEYASVYDSYVTMHYDQSVAGMSVAINHDRPYGPKELRAHIAGIDDFCATSLRALNEQLLLGRSMSRRDKARVIFDYVCCRLDYDDSETVHDAYDALGKGVGVCESYMALYSRMCNLAGIPTTARIGYTQESAQHIWAVQKDENGATFYTDPTWGDVAANTPHGMSVDDFAAYYAKRLDEMQELGDLGDDALDRVSGTPNYRYFWSDAVWGTHTAKHGSIG